VGDAVRVGDGDGEAVADGADDGVADGADEAAGEFVGLGAAIGVEPPPHPEKTPATSSNKMAWRKTRRFMMAPRFW
jgi:hypothetical protein